MKLEIRLLQTQDAEIFRQIRLRALKEHPEAFLSSFEDEVEIPLKDTVKRFQDQWNKPNNFILGAFIEEKLVGTIGFYQYEKGKIRHKGVIWGMYVAPEARQHKIGKQLMFECICLVKKLPEIEQINLVVWAENAPAKSLYSSFGFETYGLEQNEMKLNDRYIDGEYMVLRLK